MESCVSGARSVMPLRLDTGWFGRTLRAPVLFHLSVTMAIAVLSPRGCRCPRLVRTEFIGRGA